MLKNGYQIVSSAIFDYRACKFWLMVENTLKQDKQLSPLPAISDETLLHIYSLQSIMNGHYFLNCV